MASINSISTLILVLLLLLASGSSSATPGNRKRGITTKPCKKFSFYFHEIRYNGSNAKNATSAIIGSPDWGDKLTFSSPNRFGDLIAFDNPITLDNNLYSKPIGRAQGFYTYNSKETLSAWFSMSFVFRSKALNGSLAFEGANTMMETTRDLSVVGGTGAFFMARGIATLITDAYELPLYFRLRVDVKLYECW